MAKLGIYPWSNKGSRFGGKIIVAMLAAMDWVIGLGSVFKLIGERWNGAAIGWKGIGGWTLVLILITVVCKEFYTFSWWSFNWGVVVTGFNGEVQSGLTGSSFETWLGRCVKGEFGGEMNITSGSVDTAGSQGL